MAFQKTGSVSAAIVFAAGAVTVTTSAVETLTKAACYVSVDGEDAFSGRLPEPNVQPRARPFKTLQRAWEAIR